MIEPTPHLFSVSVDRVILTYFPPDQFVSGGTCVGKLDNRSAQVLRTVYEDPLVHMQLVLAHRLSKLAIR